jgi:hypothetical protein
MSASPLSGSEGGIDADNAGSTKNDYIIKSVLAMAKGLLKKKTASTAGAVKMVLALDASSHIHELFLPKPIRYQT